MTISTTKLHVLTLSEIEFKALCAFASAGTRKAVSQTFGDYADCAETDLLIDKLMELFTGLSKELRLSGLAVDHLKC